MDLRHATRFAVAAHRRWKNEQPVLQPTVAAHFATLAEALSSTKKGFTIVTLVVMICVRIVPRPIPAIEVLLMHVGDMVDVNRGVLMGIMAVLSLEQEQAHLSHRVADLVDHSLTLGVVSVVVVAVVAGSVINLTDLAFSADFLLKQKLSSIILREILIPLQMLLKSL